MRHRPCGRWRFFLECLGVCCLRQTGMGYTDNSLLALAKTVAGKHRANCQTQPYINPTGPLPDWVVAPNFLESHHGNIGDLGRSADI